MVSIKLRSGESRYRDRKQSFTCRHQSITAAFKLLFHLHVLAYISYATLTCLPVHAMDKDRQGRSHLYLPRTLLPITRDGTGNAQGGIEGSTCALNLCCHPYMQCCLPGLRAFITFEYRDVHTSGAKALLVLHSDADTASSYCILACPGV